MSEFRHHPFTSSSFSRRALIKRASALGPGAALVSSLEAFAAAGGRFPNGSATLHQSPPSIDISGTELKILQWHHFVPVYDSWFSAFVNEWGAANGVKVTLDLIDTGDIPAAFANEIDMGEGHDLIEHIEPLSKFEESVLDLTDLWEETSTRYGDAVNNCRLNSYNPTTEKYYAFCHGYAPTPGNYRKAMWEAVDFPDGPGTYDELLSGGTRIYNEQGIQMGLGMSPEVDSQIVAQAIIRAFGGAIQDENENVTIKSPETIEAVHFMKDLFTHCMTPEVFDWNAASNNQLLAAGQASYIFNGVSAYRNAQEADPDVARDIFFGTPLVGPAGPANAVSTAQAALAYQIPAYSKNPDTAKQFLLHFVENYEAAMLASLLYNLPAFPATAPGLEAALTNDPAGSEPPDKLLVLKDAAAWTVNLGWPGPTNAMMSDAQTTFILSNMMAKAAREEMSVEEAVEEAEKLLNQSADTWRSQGLMGGGQ